MEHANPPRFGTQPINNDDDLFATPPPARRAVTAVVQCRVCGEMVKVPLLSDVKVCATCISSWPTQRQRLGDAVIEAERAYDGTVAQMEAAAAAASVEDVERYSRALAARHHPRFVEKWRNAINRNDGLTPLLIAHDARALAEAALDKARSALRTAEREMERLGRHSNDYS